MFTLFVNNAGEYVVERFEDGAFADGILESDCTQAYPALERKHIADGLKFATTLSAKNLPVQQKVPCVVCCVCCVCCVLFVLFVFCVFTHTHTHNLHKHTYTGHMHHTLVAQQGCREEQSQG